MKSDTCSARRLAGRLIPLWFALLALPALSVAAGGPPQPVSCSDLAGLSLPDTTITLAEDVTPPTSIGGVPITLPFCRVAATLTPTADSSIGIEVWLPPAKSWNGKFLGTGNGGYAGVFRYPLLADGLRRDFATAHTDMGTAPSTPLNGDALIGHPEKWEDWGHRATHLMTLRAKEITKAYYAKRLKYSYFSGCSTGGQQGLMEAQRYPDDYDGILAGSAANQRTRLHNGMVWTFAATHPSPSSPVPLIPNAKLAMVQNAVIAACGTRSGGVATDPFLADPRDCDFDPGVLQCTGPETPTCLTTDQVNALRLYYAGPRNPATGEQIYEGNVRGAEAYAFGLALQQSLPEVPFGSLFKWVFGAGWDWRTYDFNNDVATVDATLGPVLNATQTNLSKFKRGGSKMILYHGFADPLVPPQGTINYYERIVAEQPGRHKLKNTKKFARLFMAPGLDHCFGGLGPNVFGGAFQPATPQLDAEHDLLKALELWVEKGKAPQRVVATKYVGDNPTNGIAMQRPLCAYPKLARYVGGGDTNDPDNFVCVRDDRGDAADDED
jgi:hypothetical protein